MNQSHDDQRSESLLSTLDQFLTKDRSRILSEKRVLVLYASGAMGGEQRNKEKLVITKGYLRDKIKENAYLCDRAVTEDNKDEFLVTPVSAYGRRTFFKVVEASQIRNSRQTRVGDVHLLAQQIMENYALYDSFIVCVGVATLTYVASLLSFMFENLQKLVVVTGCLVPISFMRNDAFQNLLNSLTLAGHFMIPEVLVVFGHQAFRGNRTRTLESDSFDGIDSPNLPPLVKFGISIDIEWGSVMRRDPSTPTTLAPSFCTDIIIIKVTPFTTFEHIKHILNTPKLRCCIFECYHYGEMPHSEELLELLKSTQEKREIVVIMIPQCIKIVTEKAGLKESYKEGLIVRYDITPEAALAKMGYLLGKNYTLTQIRGLFQKNLQGEVDSSGTTPKFEGQHQHFLQTLTELLKKNTGDDQVFKSIEFVNRFIVPNLGCYMVKVGHLEMIRELRKISRSLSLGDYDNRTMLHIAVAERHKDIIHYLVEECQVNINVVDCVGCTPMFYALLQRDKETLFYLMQNGGKVKAAYDEITNMLLDAAADGDLELIKLMYHSGFKDLNEFVNVDNRNVAHIAVCCKQLDVLFFLKYQVHFNFQLRDRWQRTPLDEARMLKSEEVVEILTRTID